LETLLNQTKPLETQAWLGNRTIDQFLNSKFKIQSSKNCLTKDTSLLFQQEVIILNL
jgi:hypothetical protein